MSSFQNCAGIYSAEGSRSNIFVRRGAILFTPPVASGLLPGCLRTELLESGLCRKAVLPETELEDEVYFDNSLRGLVRDVAS